MKDLKVICLMESDADFLRITRFLDYLGVTVIADHATTIAQFQSKLSSRNHTLVLAMSSHSEATPRQVLQQVKDSNPELPFVLISNGIGEEEVVDLMKAGAEDVVLLSRSHRLLQAVRRIMREREAKEKEAISSRMAHLAYAAREQMLAIVSHDIKNPLSAIQLEAQMLLRVVERHGKSLLGEEVKIQAGRILKTTDRLKNLISDLLDRNKEAEGLSSLAKEPTEAVRLFLDVFDANRPLIREKNITVKTIFPASSKVLMDKNKMFQVLSNLLSNSIKFAPQGGQILLSIEEREHEVLFSVEDNGLGLNPKDISKVFEKYWTGGVSGCSGTGLGLFIVKTIVEAHGGYIRVENRADGGSKFWFSLPRTLAILPRDIEKKILIIDDDEDLREVISWALSKEGYAVHSYGNAQDALENLTRGRHEPKLMVVDYHMDGMNGGEFLRNKSSIASSVVRDCPVLMISASPDEVMRSIEPGQCQKVISKPVDLEGLIENIKSFVH